MIYSERDSCLCKVHWYHISKERLHRKVSSTTGMTRTPIYHDGTALIQMRRAVDRNLAIGAEDPHLKSLQFPVAETFRIHNISTAVIACRVSPTSKSSTDNDGIKTSLLRQQRFLKAMVLSGVSIVYSKAKEVSAYKSDFTMLMQEKLRSLPTKAFVLTTSVNRAARNVENVKTYTELYERVGHMFMSFLWSDKFEFSIGDAPHMIPAA